MRDITEETNSLEIYLKNYEPLGLLEKGLSAISGSYLVVKCHSIILPNILVIEESSNVVMLMLLKCRRNRGVTGLRPPPGGPIAAII